jgi:hypothetical protein
MALFMKKRIVFHFGQKLLTLSMDLDPDPHSSERLDPDIMNAELKHKGHHNQSVISVHYGSKYLFIDPLQIHLMLFWTNLVNDERHHKLELRGSSHGEAFFMIDK